MLRMGEGHVSAFQHLYDLGPSQTQLQGRKTGLGSWFQSDISPQLQRKESVTWVGGSSVTGIGSISQRPITRRQVRKQRKRNHT